MSELQAAIENLRRLFYPHWTWADPVEIPPNRSRTGVPVTEVQMLLLRINDPLVEYQLGWNPIRLPFAHQRFTALESAYLQ
jgi:hypothetical protein